MGCKSCRDVDTRPPPAYDPYSLRTQSGGMPHDLYEDDFRRAAAASSYRTAPYGQDVIRMQPVRMSHDGASGGSSTSIHPERRSHEGGYASRDDPPAPVVFPNNIGVARRQIFPVRSDSRMSNGGHRLRDDVRTGSASVGTLDPPVANGSAVYREGDASRSRIVATPRSGVSSLRATPRDGLGLGGSSCVVDEGEELVLVCADCLAEIMDGEASAVCPVTGKRHH